MNSILELTRDLSIPGIRYAAHRPTPEGPVDLGTVTLELDGETWEARRPDGTTNALASIADAVDWLDHDRRRHDYRAELLDLAAEHRQHDPDAPTVADVDDLVDGTEIGALHDAVANYRRAIDAARVRWAGESRG